MAAIAKAGMSLESVGKALGVDSASIYKWAAECGLVHANGWPILPCNDLFTLSVPFTPQVSHTAWHLTEEGANVVNDLIAQKDTDPRNSTSC